MNSGGDIFAGTFYGGIYRSTDDGENWTAVNNGLTGLYIPALAINASGQIFAATWDVKACTGIFRSTDNGDSWTEINNGLANLCILSFAINENGDIFAGGDGLGGPAGVFRSTNNGDSWASVLDTAGNVNGLTVTPAGAIFAGTYGNGAFRSTDDGNTWTQVNTGLTAPFVISLTANQSGSIFAGTYFGGGVFRSTDNGDTWVEKNNGVVATDVRAIARRVFAVPPIQHPTVGPIDLIFAGTYGSGVFRSTNSGGSWQKTNNGLPALYESALAINDNGEIFLGADFVRRRGWRLSVYRRRRQLG